MTYMSAPGIKQTITFTPQMIIEHISDHFQVSVEALKSRSRMREKVYPRQLCFYFIKMLTNTTLKNIGLIMGGRDHSTSIHAITSVKNDIATNPEIAQQVRILNNYFVN